MSHLKRIRKRKTRQMDLYTHPHKRPFIDLENKKRFGMRYVWDWLTRRRCSFSHIWVFFYSCAPLLFIYKRSDGVTVLRLSKRDSHSHLLCLDVNVMRQHLFPLLSWRCRDGENYWLRGWLPHSFLFLVLFYSPEFLVILEGIDGGWQEIVAHENERVHRKKVVEL